MTAPEFEEKSFEAPLSAQLLGGSPYLYAPGQVLESALGFDAAMLCHHAGFWSLWGRPTPLGIIAAPGWWPPSPTALPSLPRFNLNLFLQYKRSQRLDRSNAKEWAHWFRPYFRYDVVAHQQAALEACASGLGGNGLVVYAAPAFVSMTDLFAHTAGGTLVSATNFVEAINLRAHARYTFSSAGTAGVALSEPAEVPPVSMSEDMGRRTREAPELPRGTDILELASSAVKTAMVETWEARNVEQFEGLLEQGAALLANTPPMRRRDTDGAKLRAYLRVQSFCLLSGWSWIVGGPAPIRG